MVEAAARLENKIALITGGNRGIGRAIAQIFGDEGATVIITGRDQGALDSTSEAIGVRAVPVRCDLTNTAEVQRLFADIERRFGRIDLLVNNAGTAHALANVDRLSIAEWKRVIDTNLTATFLCTQLALPLMDSEAVIVNNLSISARQAFPGAAAYNASKSGALGFTNTLRIELREKGIRVIALLSGAVDTDIWQQFWPDAPRQKMVDPEDVARAVLLAVTLPSNTSMDEIQIGPAIGTL